MSEQSHIELTKPISSHRKPGYVHPPGTKGVVVESLGDNAWIIEVRVHDSSLVGDAWYETLDTYGHEFKLCVPKSRARPRPQGLGRIQGVAHILTHPWRLEPTTCEPVAATPEKLAG
jgi:hypothetical protein